MSLDPLSTVVTALKREQLMPDVLPESFYPSGVLSIVFPSGRKVTIGALDSVLHQSSPLASFAPSLYDPLSQPSRLMRPFSYPHLFRTSPTYMCPTNRRRDPP